ncbi:MAG: AAA family ATPase [Thaumarchaeota archaeon]|nr:AAA family ATPase [Nitrososphaerota archaeon]
MEAIIMCGMPAVGKTTAAKTIAKSLGLKVVGGGDILKEIAIEQGYNAVGDDWWDSAEGMRFLKKREGSSKFDKEVDERLLKKVERGNVVITSYTLPWLSKKGIKVWLAGSPQKRAERMAKRDGTTPEACMAVIAQRDRENFKLYKKLYKIEFGKDLSPFHLVVGTDDIKAPRVSREVLDYVTALSS